MASRILKRLGREAAAKADDAILNAAARTRQAARDINNGGRFTCSCGEKTCPGSFRSLRAQKAHAAKTTMNRWTSAKARKVGRAMGKAKDNARQTARSWLVVAGLRDQSGRRTDRDRSRPELRGQITIKQLREAHRHDRDHEKADRLERKADTHSARGNHIKARQRREDARNLRWPVPGRPVPADSNGHRPEPARAGRAPR